LAERTCAADVQHDVRNQLVLPGFTAFDARADFMAAVSEDATVNEPVDMVRLSLDDRVFVKCR
jgi:hypothetical protein